MFVSFQIFISKYSLNSMSTRIIIASNNEGRQVNGNLMVLGLLLMSIGFKLGLLKNEFLDARQSLFPLSTGNTTDTTNQYRCDVPFDDCRCSMLSNKSETSIKCITDAQAMNAHIIPLISYVVHLYIIYKCSSITGKYSRILTDLFWVIALAVFVVIAIAVHGSSCIHYYTTAVLSLSSVFLSCAFLGAFAYAARQEVLDQQRNISRNQRMATNNGNRSNHRDDRSLIVIVCEYAPLFFLCVATGYACAC